MLTAEEARQLLASIETDMIIGLRDCRDAELEGGPGDTAVKDKGAVAERAVANEDDSDAGARFALAQSECRGDAGDAVADDDVVHAVS